MHFKNLKITSSIDLQPYDYSHLLTGYNMKMETAVAEWLRCCATNRKVVASIPDGVIGIFH